jgi:type II secretory pathway pseudopilin PulG
MPEHDLSKHTKKIINTIKEPGKSWKHKLGEILIDVAIIVFGITLSLMVERWRENVHERAIEKKFLSGLRIDLQNDIQQLQSDSATYYQLYKGWHYLRNAGVKKITLNSDSAILYATTLTNTTEFIPNDSRFQALKSSGQINVIENDSLQNLILDLYQNRIASLKLTTSYITNFKTQLLLPFLSKNMRFNDADNTTNLQDVIVMPEMQNYLLLGGFGAEAMERYHAIIDESKKIIDMINKQYD